ncbi:MULTISPECIES: type II toxin-antitoxin system death-on-curing family toxin [Prauserella salsuginis group]|uniref:Death-on-curing protein n=2 Tax=Prauserella salsuginis group TaxID=2893672 RepID=A0A839XHK6_9PSEU|nr:MULTISPECIES: type II toxin-antitoxin system death-on-curing family toxin [Prauserella salsuginis group]MBB3661229.1 death-on-curing protein [Prauserella sediminis]MCR3719090.1 death on curing protein [Prauserella flava]MCR3733660.1 death on curing protein [Prauserella salsuginis]
MPAVYYLDVEDVLTATHHASGAAVDVRDFGLLSASVARPSATVFGQDAYPDLLTKAAALLHSLVRNHALVDGNKRAAWAGAWVFLEVNGHRLRDPIDVDSAEQLVTSAAKGVIDVPEIAEGLRAFLAT